MENNIKYFEVIMGNFENGLIKDSMCICIKADHYVTYSEVKEFCKEDMELFGITDIINITELSKENAYAEYDMEREDVPVLTKATPPTKELKTFKIPVIWQEYGYVYIDAESLEEACNIAETDDTIELPDGDYLDGSWEVDWDFAKELSSNK